MLSCSQSQKPANAVSNAAADSLSTTTEAPSTSLDSSKWGYAEGFIFEKDVYRLDSVSGLHKRMGIKGHFCFDDYEFPHADNYGFLNDSNGLLYYCPGTQDGVWYSGYLTKEEFKEVARPVKAYFDAPDSWIEGREYTFTYLTRDMDITRIKRIRVQDPDAVLFEENEKRDSLYGKDVYVIDGMIYCGEFLTVANQFEPENRDLKLSLSDSGYFSMVNRKTHQVTPTSKVETICGIPDFQWLLFINDSIITMDDEVLHRVEGTSRILFDSNTPFHSPEPPTAEQLAEAVNCVSDRVYTVTSDSGQYEYSVEIMKDTCPDVDFIDYHGIKIYSQGELQTFQYGEFYRYKGYHFNTNPSRPFGTISTENGCTYLFFIEDDRPFGLKFCIYALKEGNVSCVYHESGVIIGSYSLLLQYDNEEGQYIYEIITRDGKLIRIDYE